LKNALSVWIGFLWLSGGSIEIGEYVD